MIPALEMINLQQKKQKKVEKKERKKSLDTLQMQKMWHKFSCKLLVVYVYCDFKRTKIVK